jgi:hypothetical protein
LQIFLERFVKSGIKNEEYKRELLRYVLEALKTYGSPKLQIQALTFLITVLRTKKEDQRELVDWKVMAVWTNAMKRIPLGKRFKLTDHPIPFFERKF